jgi:porphyrinogen peroxidase
MTQQGILAPVPALGRVLSFDVSLPGLADAALARLNEQAWPGDVIGVSSALIALLGGGVPGFVGFPRLEGAKVEIPVTQSSLMVMLRGDDPAELVRRGEFAAACLDPAFTLTDCDNIFRHREGRDLTGYIDGTENPESRAEEVALVSGRGPGLDGGSFVVLQRFKHDLAQFRRFTSEQRDQIMGRHLETNEELGDAPPTAHVKRTAQESFAPPAFVLRRSMPYQRGAESGLVFVAYGASLEPYAALLRRMVGAEDGLVDSLFQFSTPVSGAAYFCPPRKGESLDLSRIRSA